MPNGKPGDHPITDILVWDREVYGPELDGLLREVCALCDAVPPSDERRHLAESLRENPILELLFAAENDLALRPVLERELLTLRAQLRDKPLRGETD
jgi:hypothetical protein